MKKIENYEEIQAVSGDFEKPKAGGYVCKIVAVEDVPYNAETDKGDYLRIEYDIAEGKLYDYYKLQRERWGTTWKPSFIRSYKEKALGMFKHFTNCVEKSNDGYSWNWDEKSLVGKLIGLVFGEEEYENGNGELKTRLIVKNIKTVDDIENGIFKIPQLTKLKRADLTEQFNTPSADIDDLPF